MAEVLVIGGGGREEELRQSMLASPEVDRAEVYDDARVGLGQFSGGEKPFVVIGPEAPLVDGLADELRSDGYTVFGVDRLAARYEASKSFSVMMMRESGVLHPPTYISRDPLGARDYVDLFDHSKYVIKADGLAGGKGVVLPASEHEAVETTQGMLDGTLFGGAGAKIINYAARHHGPEVSAMVVVGGRDEEFVILPLAQDHKRLEDGDGGPNTGGMGAYAPVPESIVSPYQYEEIEELAYRSLWGMNEYGTPFRRGVLYMGLMMSEETGGAPEVIEYNVRFGDPETQVILPLAQAAGADIYRLLRSAAEGELEYPNVDFSKLSLSALTVCLAAEGYPESPRKGNPIYGLGNKYPGVTVQEAAVDDLDRTAGGRVLYVTGLGEGIDQATRLTYGAIDTDRVGVESGKIGFEGMQFRTDIGHQARSAQ